MKISKKESKNIKINKLYFITFVNISIYCFTNYMTNASSKLMYKINSINVVIFQEQENFTLGIFGKVI
tara:strand:+ start:76 stop:279 length:204 start_codon:yes stop_codon:yes gene_type:complete